jgi:hypothetical protein
MSCIAMALPVFGLVTVTNIRDGHISSLSSYTHVGFEDLPAVVVKRSVLGDVTPCSPGFQRNTQGCIPEDRIVLKACWFRTVPWLETSCELYRPSDRRFSAKLVPTFADIGCLMVSATDPYGRINFHSSY